MNNIEGVDLLISADVNKKKKIRKFPGMYGTRTDLSIIRKCNSVFFEVIQLEHGIFTLLL